MPGKALRVGVVGSGEIAQIMHLRYLSELAGRFSIVALCETDEVVLESVARQFFVPNSYRDYTRMLNEADLDAVFVLTPGNHTQIVLEALSAGLHVFVEKPLCYRSEEAEAILDEARLGNRVVMVGYTRLFDPGFRSYRRLVEAATGPKSLNVTVAFPPDLHYRRHHRVLRSPGWSESEVRRNWGSSWRFFVEEILFNLVIHDVYCLRALLGGKPQLISAHQIHDRRGLHASWTHEDEWHVSLTAMTLSGLGGGYREEFRVVADSGEYTLDFPSAYLSNLPSKVSWRQSHGGALKESSLLGPYEEGFKLEVEHFHEAVHGAECLSAAESAKLDIDTLWEVYMDALAHAPDLK